MRVVVTGASGNVGTSVVSRLLANPEVESIVGVCRRPPALRQPGVTWHGADVGIDPLVPVVAGADAVIHLAWQIQPGHDTAQLARTNVIGTRRVVDAVVATGVPTLIYASSVGTYARGPKDHPVDESWPATGVPGSLYSAHKAAVERLLDSVAAASSGLRIVKLRKALVFKAGAATGIARLFLPRWLPTPVLGRRWVPAMPTFDRLALQVVHTDDAAAAYEQALVTGGAEGAFNIAADGVLGGRELADALGARPVPVPLPALRAVVEASWRARLQPVAGGWVDLAAGVPLMDTGRARRELGWAPTQDAGATFEDLLGGFARRAGLPTAPLRPPPGGELLTFHPTSDPASGATAGGPVHGGAPATR
ncbi:MAG: NAD-dependent epimerase/dehydratase family protein [Acidimicrobiales bacterium]